MQKLAEIGNAISEFNRFFSPEAEVSLLNFDESKSILKVSFSGSFCRTCGYYDYFDDFKYILKDFGVNASIKKIRENNSGAVVSYVIKKEQRELIEEIKKLKESNVKEKVDKRIREFEELGRKSIGEIFKELCFCILTANFNAEKSIEIQNRISDGFLRMSREELEKELLKLGHRYPRKRAEFIFEARAKIKELEKAISELRGNELREYIVKNFKGLGYKEASHFLRNIGFKDYAIIDYHILDILEKYNYIEAEKKSMTGKRYLQIESILRKIAEQSKLNLAELDLYLWYMETGKVLK